MKTVEIVVGIIIEDNKLLSFKRTKGNYAGYYELAGGKIEKDESHSEALIRELKEELFIDANIGKYVDTIYYNYPDFNLCMHCYMIDSYIGKIKLLEHSDIQYLSKNELDSVEWLEATKLVINKLNSVL